MTLFAWPWREPGKCRRRDLLPRTRLNVEALETRTLLSAPQISGPASVPEGSLYTLQLEAADAAIHEWQIDWGDGTTEIAPASATALTHDYGDGPHSFVITVQAVEQVSFPILQWSSADGGNGHYYALTATPSNWTTAEQAAVNLGGHLVSITSAQEQAFVVQTFLAAPNARAIYWLGLSDFQNEGVYAWSSGEAVSYTNWQPPNEPNNFGGNEDYVSINWHYGNGRANATQGTWNDSPLDGINSALTGPEPYRGIIEFDSLPTGPVTTLSLPVNIDNVAPVPSVVGPATAIPLEAVQLAVSASDPSAADQNAGFTYAIDWQSDGKTDEVVTGTDAVFVHKFVRSGVYNVTITVTDRDGDAATIIHTLTLLSAKQQVAALKSEIEALVASGALKKRDANPLLNKLHHATKQLENNKVQPAINTMKATKNQIAAYAKRKTLAKADAVQLTEMLNHAIVTAKLDAAPVVPKKKK